LPVLELVQSVGGASLLGERVQIWLEHSCLPPLKLIARWFCVWFFLVVSSAPEVSRVVRLPRGLRT
jgi:hypothetical protein